MKPLQIGIVGSQFIANLHMLSYGKLDRSKFNIKGVTSKNTANAKKLADQHKLEQAYTTFAEMLADPARRKALGRAAHKLVSERYSPAAVAQQMEQAYEQVLRQ